MDAGSSTYPHLFSEIEVGARTLRNRIALPATLTNFGAWNRITDRVIEVVDTVVYATPRRVVDALARGLADLSPSLIGDCLAPRNLSIAIHEGHAVGDAL